MVSGLKGELRGFWCKYAIKPGHTDTITPQKGCDQYGKGNFI